MSNHHLRNAGLSLKSKGLPGRRCSCRNGSPGMAGQEKLWNAVEEAEKTKDSRLAREFVAALPIELSRQQQIELLQEFIREQFVDEGMCADVAIHDTDGHNPTPTSS